MNSKLRESVTPNPWRLSKRVLPQHTDHAGVVWHGTYVAWLEEARVEALAMAGASYGEIAARGLEMPVVSLQIEYRRSLHHGDIVHLDSVCGPQRRPKALQGTRLLVKPLIALWPAPADS